MKASLHDHSRWMRGFSRFGLVLGAIAALVVVGIGAVVVTDTYRRDDFQYEKRACLLAENGNRPMHDAEFKSKAVASRCGDFSPEATYRSLEWHEFGRSINENGFFYLKTSDAERGLIARTQIGLTMAIAAGALVLTYLMSWLVGWIFVRLIG
jgi:hypothetical protein